MLSLETFAPLQIFVVEDEALVQMMIVDMLEELGHRVSCGASGIERGVTLARQAAYDLALLDVNLAGSIVTPIAEVVEARRLPIVFATGYGTAGLPEGFRQRPCVQKPFMADKLGRTIDRAMSEHRANHTP